MADIEGTTASYVLTTKTNMNIKMLHSYLTNDDHYISVAANFPTIIPETIIDTLNCI